MVPVWAITGGHKKNDRRPNGTSDRLCFKTGYVSELFRIRLLRPTLFEPVFLDSIHSDKVPIQPFPTHSRRSGVRCRCNRSPWIRCLRSRPRCNRRPRARCLCCLCSGRPLLPPSSHRQASGTSSLQPDHFQTDLRHFQPGQRPFQTDRHLFQPGHHPIQPGHHLYQPGHRPFRAAIRPARYRSGRSATCRAESPSKRLS